VRKEAISLLVAGVVLVTAAPVCAQTPQELFQTLKQKVNAGSWSDALATLARLDVAAATTENESLRERMAVAVAFYRGVCQANLGRSDEAVKSFREFFTFQPDATIDERLFSLNVVKAFETARKASSATRGSIAQSYARFRGSVPSVDDPADPRWADGPVKWILTPEELTEWSQLTDLSDRISFVRRFWAARSNLLDRNGHSFQEEFERRVAYADQEFAEEDGERRGSLTDRGMVFVLLGPPVSAARERLRGSSNGVETGGETRQVPESDFVKRKTNINTSLSVQARYAAKLPGVENKVPSLEYEYLETWHFDSEISPMPVGFRELDVHYVTKRGRGRSSLQRDPTTISALGAAAQNGAGRRAAKVP